MSANSQLKKDINRRQFLQFSGLGALGFSLAGCALQRTGNTVKSPNIVFIMADDLGYECLSCNGSLSYQTPVLDNLARKGIRFTQCHAQPLCTPTRVKLMTGKYNYRNYQAFGYLNPQETTFGNILKDAGYATCVVGKWQLNGLSGKKIPGWQDKNRPNHFGFDEYCLWQLTHGRKDGERYANPLLEQNGRKLPRNPEAYGSDVFTNYALDFIERKKDRPFLLYYPMALTHNPFVPTPDSPEWKQKELRYKNDPKFFADMVRYTDKIVGKFVKKIRELGIEKNTLLIFLGDNGTNRNITSQTKNGPVRGAKGNTTDAGTRVPLILYWPAMKNKGLVFDGFIDLTDFYATFADIAFGKHRLTGTPDYRDGKSLLPLMMGETYQPREILFMHYEPHWGAGSKFSNRFARTHAYKLYQDGRFYNVETDPLEQKNISESGCSNDQLKIRRKLQSVLDSKPAWKIPADAKR